MSKKILNTQAMMNELRGQSAFFRPSSPIQSETDKPKPKTTPKIFKRSKKHSLIYIKNDVRKPILHQEHYPTNLQIEKKNDSVSKYTSNQAHVQASMLASLQDDIVETIRKTVKQVGKDTLFVRLTSEEKHQIASSVFALNEMYRGEGRKTTENELGRIALSFLLEDYKINGKESMIVKVLTALNA